jgi:hypothetical protein
MFYGHRRFRNGQITAPFREQDLGNDGEKSTLLLPLVPGSQRDGWREALSIRTPNTSKPQSQLVHILVPVLDYAYAEP